VGADLSSLVRAAAAGDEAAWSALVDRFERLVWSVARDHGLSLVDSADVSQTTWLKLTEKLADLREPERVGAWLATTARYESLEVLRREARQVPVDAVRTFADRLDASEVEQGLLDEERDAELWRAFNSLSPPCKVLLRAMLADPKPSYAEISVALGLPMGSIGPTRNRCLDRLRRHVARVSSNAILNNRHDREEALG